MGGVVARKRGWCELFQTCVKGGGKRKFRTFVKAKGFRYYKGACANKSGKYGKKRSFLRHKTWAQCRHECQRQSWCQGMTMPWKIGTAAAQRRAHKAHENRNKERASKRRARE